MDANGAVMCSNALGVALRDVVVQYVTVGKTPM